MVGGAEAPRMVTGDRARVSDPSTSQWWTDVMVLMGSNRAPEIARDGSALPGWGRQGRAPDVAPYFFFAFFLVAFFFIVSPPSRSPRVPRWLIVSDSR